MSLREVQARTSGGSLLFGISPAKVVADPDLCRPEVQEFMTRIEVGIDKRLSELKPGDVVALAPDGSGSVVLAERLGPWDDRMATHGPLTRWSAAWADDAIAGLLPYPVTVHGG